MDGTVVMTIQGSIRSSQLSVEPDGETKSLPEQSITATSPATRPRRASSQNYDTGGDEQGLLLHDPT
ncbi:hypothetical protein ACW9HM_02045 [Nocardia gipuzkoensis]